MRDSTPLGVSRVNVPQLNLNALKTDGVDFEIDYRVPIDRFSLPGKLNIRALGTCIHNSRTITATTDIDSAGMAGTPKWSWNIRINYGVGDFSASLMTRYTAPIKYSATLIGPDDPNYNVALSNSINRNLWPKALYFNTYFSYTIHTGDDRSFRIYANIDNILDQQGSADRRDQHQWQPVGSRRPGVQGWCPGRLLDPPCRGYFKGMIMLKSCKSLSCVALLALGTSRVGGRSGGARRPSTSRPRRRTSSRRRDLGRDARR